VRRLRGQVVVALSFPDTLHRGAQEKNTGVVSLVVKVYDSNGAQEFCQCRFSGEAFFKRVALRLEVSAFGFEIFDVADVGGLQLSLGGGEGFLSGSEFFSFGLLGLSFC